MRGALAVRWFPDTQVNTRPLSEVGADVVVYQLTAVVLHGGRSPAATGCSDSGYLSSVWTARTNLRSVATCCKTGRRDRSAEASQAPSATATHATPDALPRRRVTGGGDLVADVVLS